MPPYHRDNEAGRLVDAYIAKNVCNISLQHILQISGVYPKMDGRYKILSIFQLTIYIFMLIFNLVLLVNSISTNGGFNMVLLSQSVHYCLLLQTSLVVLLTWIWKNLKLFLILRYLACDFYDYQDPPVRGEDQLRSQMKAERRFLTVLPVGVVLAGGILLIVTPIIDFHVGSFDFDKSSDIFDYQFPYPYAKYPFYVEDGFGYFLALSGQLASGFIMAVVIGGGFLIFIHLAESIILQIKILNNSLDNIESRIEYMHFRLFGKMDKSVLTSLKHDSRYAYCYTKCLRKNFEHHQVILRAFNLLEDIYNVPIACAFLVGAIVIALSLISAGSMKELPGTSTASIILCGFEVGYVYLISALGQRISDLSTELRYKMYNSRWYIYSKEIKSSLMIFQEVTLKPMTLTAGKVVPANMETFSTVMKSAYSYYNLVNAVGKK